MPKRPTFPISVGDHKFEIYSYITAGEIWDIREIYTSGLRAEERSEERNTMDRRAETKGFELIVASMDGSQTDIIQRIMLLPLSEYRELVSHVEPILDPKKKSETPSPNTQPTDLSKTTS